MQQQGDAIVNSFIVRVFIVVMALTFLAAGATVMRAVHNKPQMQECPPYDQCTPKAFNKACNCWAFQ